MAMLDYVHWKLIPLYLVAPIIIFILKHTLEAIYNLYFHPLSKYPGPRSWAASPFPRIRDRGAGTEMWKRLEAHKKYGTIVRMSPNELSIIDERVWKDVWAHRQGHQEFSKDQKDRIAHPNGLFGILNAGREEHSRFRRLLSHAFSEKGMREQQGHIIKYVDMLIDDLKSVANEGAQDMVQWFNFTTFDVIGKLAFGQDFGCLEKKQNHPWIAMIFGNLKALVVLGNIRRLGIEWLLPYIATPKQAEARVYNFNFTTDMMKARVARGDDQLDFWDNVLKHEEKSTGMNFDEMVSNASNLVLAGSETTATLLSGAMYQLCKNPRVLAKVTKEIRDTYSTDAEIDLFSTSKLKYTLAVLEETMRVYPPVPTQTSRTVPRGGDTVLGDFLPEGTIINTPQYIVAHYPPFWTRVEEFIPERFLGDEEFKNDNFAAMQPFSVGPRNCIGKNLAYAEMRLIFCRFLWNFDIELDEKMARSQWTDQKTFVLWEKNPLWIKLKPVH